MRTKEEIQSEIIRQKDIIINYLDEPDQFILIRHDAEIYIEELEKELSELSKTQPIKEHFMEFAEWIGGEVKYQYHPSFRIWVYKEDRVTTEDLYSYWLANINS